MELSEIREQSARESVLFSPHCVCLQPWRTLSAKCFSENRISVIAYNLNKYRFIITLISALCQPISHEK